MKLGTNELLGLSRGIAIIDVSTPSWPGAVTMIDEADIPVMLDGLGRWYPFRTPRSHTPYVIRRQGAYKYRKCHWLHRDVMGIGPLAQDQRRIDHRNGDGLDNTRLNLRFADTFGNAWNTRTSKRGHPGLKGVSFRKDRGYWRSQITTFGKAEFLGYFATAEEAAAAYDQAAINQRGEFARTNFGGAV